MIRNHALKLIKSLQRPYDTYNRIEVSRSALLHNANFYKSMTGLEVIPVLKGNAYGHGIEQVATALKAQKFPYIAVDGYFEALKVRAYNNNPVLVMGMIKLQNFSNLRLTGLTFVIQDEPTILALGALNKKIKIHLELNTGMNRYGISLAKIDKFISLIKQYPKLELEGVMSHLADADGDNEPTVAQATKLFDDSIEKILTSGLAPKYFHVAQSAGSFRAQSRYANAVRVGLGLYGINPFPIKNRYFKFATNLQPALKLISTISKVQQLEKGDKVSYNYTFTASKAMQIGVLPLGYHEGLSRNLSNKGSVSLHGKSLSIVGRVCMNHTMISLDNIAAKVGDEIIVYSDNPADDNSINKIVAEHDEFAYTLLTGLSSDVRRYLVK
jgi:alanine racemase